MNVSVRLIFLSATALAVAPPATGLAQTIKTPPRGGAIVSGPYSTAARGPNGEVISGPGGSAVRGPNSGARVRGPNSTAAAPARIGAAAVGPAYGASTGRAYYYGGHRYYGVHAPAFIYPPGWAYRHWVVGATLPTVLLTGAYSYAGYAAMGLPAPAAGHQWLRYGPDLLLADTRTGAVIHAAYGVFERR